MARSAAAAVAAALLILTAVTGCGQGSEGKGSESADPPVTTGPAEVTRMKKLVDAAESAAAAAESAVAEDGKD
ncbi:hypothetical protein [Streptomyces sp. NRRL B-24720]|uniref:hypothetical protein n=1 Tax=Streptomyces sp. NRRL B-24720 TaxID=1476876 RepID=UPI0004C50FDF|nr:hypothetical protein [Streptomyces sp. NRRL B-24720]